MKKPRLNWKKLSSERYPFFGICNKHSKKAEELEAQLKRQEESRKRGEHAASMLDMDEAETRRRLIDTQLVSAGWNVGSNLEATMQVTQEHPVKEQPTKTGDGYADYELWDERRPACGGDRSQTNPSRCRERPKTGRTLCQLAGKRTRPASR